MAYLPFRCDYCDKGYRTDRALAQHFRDSPLHHICPVCDFDGDTWDELLDHCRASGCRSVCQGCDDGRGTHWAIDCQEYIDHLQDEIVCEQCERHFGSWNNLDQHMLSHRKPQIKCLRCTQGFTTYGGMIIHLEYGSCSDIDTTDINQLAAKCREWRHFIDEDYLEDMRGGIDLTHHYQDPRPYKCPDCDTSLPKLSSLFQHVESSSCDQTLDEGAIGTLRRFLASRL